jgi:hypothetical protein
LVQGKLYGAVVAVPRNVAPWKKSTFVTVPSRSLAVAVMVMLAGADTTALFAGAVMLTVGGTSTKMLTAAEVVAVPRLSVAFAMRECVPPVALTIVAL